MPIDVRFFTHPLSGAEKAQGCAHRNVERLGEAVHRYLDVGVGQVDGFLCQARQLSAEQQCRGLGQVKVANHCVVLVRQCGDNTVALVVQGVAGLLDGAVFVEVNPFRAAHSHVAGWVEAVVVLHYVHILHAEAVATAKHCACIVRLIDVFQQHGDMSCAVLHKTVEQPAFVVGKELGKRLVQLLLLLVGVLVEKTFVYCSFWHWNRLEFGFGIHCLPDIVEVFSLTHLRVALPFQHFGVLEVAVLGNGERQAQAVDAA